MINLRKQFINKIYYKYIDEGKSPLLIYLKNVLEYSERKRLNAKHAIAQKYPNIIKPDVDLVSIALTSQCNLKCQGCSYGREFMPKEHIPLNVVKEVLDNMKEMGVPKIHLYGGEPIMIQSSELEKIISYATKLGIYTTLGTNGVLLTPALMDKLYNAGLRRVSTSIYGVEEEYNTYVNREDVFSQLDQNISYIKKKYPDVVITFAWLLMKPTCNLKSIEEIALFAQKYSTSFVISLVHYDFPYFTNGKDEELQLFEEDLPEIMLVTQGLIRLKKMHPNMINNSLTALNAIPDWLIKKEAIDIPCYRYEDLWIGANGEVRVCQKSAILGNVNETRLSDIMHTKEHTQSARDCFALNCSGCHVDYDNRTTQTPKSRKEYLLK